MVARKTSRSAEIHDRLSHPVIDADAHVQEVMPVLVDYVTKVGGAQMGERFYAGYLRNPLPGPSAPWYQMSPKERFERRAIAPSWWSTPTRNTLDRATSHLPRLMYERLDEMGIDFAIIYPTAGLHIPANRDDELRRALCRAFNSYQAETYREFADRITPAAVIPMQTPQEAVDELEYAVRVLGLKAAMIPGYITRRTADPRGNFGQTGRWMDTYGIDSQYDYDPVWAKCVELGVPPANHTGGYGWGARQSVSNFQFNGSGNFGMTGEALCKSLFMGGVTRRFPTLNVAFLEGGVAWACELYTQMVFRWKKRNPRALLEHLDPELLDLDGVMRYVDRYGDERMRNMAPQVREYLALREPRMENLDDWVACKIERAEDIRELFEPRFYFGCEGEDPLAPWAFNSRANPLGARLRPVFGSDISHWDVQDMSDVLEEAHENVDKGLMSAEDFRDFVFANPVRMYGGMNSDCFKGTVVEAQAAKLLAQGT